MVNLPYSQDACIAELVTDVKWLKEEFKDLAKTLKGNGRPGIIEQVNEMQTIKRIAIWAISSGCVGTLMAGISLVKAYLLA